MPPKALATWSLQQRAATLAAVACSLDALGSLGSIWSRAVWRKTILSTTVVVVAASIYYQLCIEWMNADRLAGSRTQIACQEDPGVEMVVSTLEAKNIWLFGRDGLPRHFSRLLR